MQLLRNHAKFKEWEADNIAQGDEVEEPREFPCYVYTVVTNWDNQDVKAIYIYADTLQEMLAEMTRTQ